jgi:hypothetical protein
MRKLFVLLLQGAAVGQTYDNSIMVCGGYTNAISKSTNICRTLNNGTWNNSTLTLTTARQVPTSHFSPDNFGNGRIFFASGSADQVPTCSGLSLWPKFTKSL